MSKVDQKILDRFDELIERGENPQSKKVFLAPMKSQLI
jgi:hypothetical protein